MIGRMGDAHRSHQPGPRRPAGSPSGPDQVRRAVLDAAVALFAQRGVDAVSLRDIAAAADVHVALIIRYIGHREELVAEVFRHVSDQLARAVEENPLATQGFSPDTMMGKWARIAAALVISGRSLESRRDFNPVVTMAQTLMARYGMADEAARLRAAQIVAAALGWRIFEAYLVEAAGLDDVPLETLRDELARSARQLGAIPWPSPPDPKPPAR
jgi:TetR/AcrR family transcriptional regulator, repressor for neighboring sulfatase